MLVSINVWQSVSSCLEEWKAALSCPVRCLCNLSGDIEPASGIESLLILTELTWRAGTLLFSWHHFSCINPRVDGARTLWYENNSRIFQFVRMPALSEILNHCMPLALHKSQDRLSCPWGFWSHETLAADHKFLFLNSCRYCTQFHTKLVQSNLLPKYQPLCWWQCCWTPSWHFHDGGGKNIPTFKVLWNFLDVIRHETDFLQRFTLLSWHLFMCPTHVDIRSLTEFCIIGQKEWDQRERLARIANNKYHLCLPNLCVLGIFSSWNLTKRLFVNGQFFLVHVTVCFLIMDFSSRRAHVGLLRIHVFIGVFSLKIDSWWIRHIPK